MLTQILSQWGNLLVLAVCYDHQLLTRFIAKGLLEHLFSRTIAFFRLITHVTSPLQNDMNILIGLARDLDLDLKLQPDDDDPRANSSFSSIASAGQPLPMHHPGNSYQPGTPIMPPPQHGIP